VPATVTGSADVSGLLITDQVTRPDPEMNGADENDVIAFPDSDGTDAAKASSALAVSA